MRVIVLVGFIYFCDVKASPVTIYMGNCYSHGAAMIVLVVTYFLFSFPTWSFGWDLGLKCVILLHFSNYFTSV